MAGSPATAWKDLCGESRAQSLCSRLPPTGCTQSQFSRRGCPGGRFWSLPFRKVPGHHAALTPTTCPLSRHRAILPFISFFVCEETFAFPPPYPLPPPHGPRDQRRHRTWGRFLGSAGSNRSQTFAPVLGLHHPHHTLGEEEPAPFSATASGQATPPPPGSPQALLPPSSARYPSSALSAPRCPPPSLVGCCPSLKEEWLIWRAKCPLCLPGIDFGICC